MATAVITNKQPVVTKKIEEKQNNGFRVIPSKRISVVEEILPFRVRFTAIQVPGFSPSVVPPIPLQVIGFSNYIL